MTQADPPRALGASCAPCAPCAPCAVRRTRAKARRPGGFTLVELLVVVTIIAIGSAGVSFAMRNASETQLEREALRLAALLETARAQSRATGQPLHWRAVAGGFRFEGSAETGWPGHWLSGRVQVAGAPVLILGPEPVIGAQSIALSSPDAPGREVRIATDGLHPFTVQPQEAAP